MLNVWCADGVFLESLLNTLCKQDEHVALGAGLVLAPMSYAPSGAQGLPFVPSMALGQSRLLSSLLLLTGKAEASEFAGNSTVHSLSYW